MKHVFLFQTHNDPGWSPGRRAGFWLWNLFWVAAASLCVGTLSLYFAAVFKQAELFGSYFKNPLIALLNLAPVLLLALGLYFLTGRPGLAYGLTAGLTAGFTMGNWFKLQFRNDPLLFEDLLLLKEAGNMAGKYQLFLSRTMALALALLLLGGVFFHFCVRGRLKGQTRYRFLGISAVILAALPLQEAILSDSVYQDRTANNDLINRWSATQVYVSKGFVYPFLYSVKSASDAPPEGYDAKRAEAMLNAYQDADIPEDQKVSLITIMLEAYSDLSGFDIPGLSDRVYADYHALEAESYTGNLITNIFAGGTVDTERCYLTGFSRLGSFRSPTNSYPWYFRSQGYSVLGAHPCFSWFYNRENINRNLGYEDYWFVENHFAPLTGGDVGYDKVLFPELIGMWEENRSTGKPLFAYNLTYQGHGPYDADVTWWGDDYVTGGDYTDAERNILNNYFGSIYDTNQHLTEFFDYYRQAEEPVVIVLFGDHKPWLGDGNSVYETLGINLDFSTEEGFYHYYATRYLIWANDAAKDVLGNNFTGEGPDLGPYFLMNQVFRLCGWEGPAFVQATQQVMDRVPVHNTPTGLYVEQGVLTGSLTPEGQALVDDYNTMQYYWRKHFAYEK